MTNSIYGISRGEGLKYKYIDLLENRISKEDSRTGDEIAADIIQRLELRFKE